MSLAYGGGISYGHWITAALADVGVNTGSLSVVVKDPETKFDFTCETHLFPRHALSFVRFWAPDQTPGQLNPAKTGAVKIEEDGNEVSPGYWIEPPDAAIGDLAVVHLGSAVVTITDWIEKPGEPGEYLGFTYVLEGDPVVVDVKAARSIWRTTLEASGLWSLDGMCDPTTRPLHFCQPSTIESIFPVTNNGSVPATPYVALGPASNCELFDATLETSNGVLAAGPLCDLLGQPYQISPQLDPGDTTLVTLSISLADPELDPGEYSAHLTVTGFVTQWNLPLENAGLGWTAAADLPLNLTVTVEPPDYGYGDCDDDCDGDDCDDDEADVAATGVDDTPGDPRSEETPIEEPSVAEPVVEEPAAEIPPVDEPPDEQAPVDEPPSQDPPVDEASVDESPADEQVVDEFPAEDPPVEEAANEDVPDEQTPVEEPPAEEDPFEDPAGDEAPGKEPTGTDTQRASLAGFVWHDLDSDGLAVLGGPEKGLADVEVALLDDEGLEVQVVTTLGNGFYLFTDLEPGTYVVGFYPPDGFGIAEPSDPAAAFDSPEDYEVFLAGLAKEMEVLPEELVLSDLVELDDQDGPLIGLTAPVFLADGENLGVGDAALIAVEDPEILDETADQDGVLEAAQIPEPPAEPPASDQADTSTSPANPDGDAKEPEPDPVEETVPPENPPDPVDEIDPDQPDPGGEQPAEQEIPGVPPADPAVGETTP